VQLALLLSPSYGALVNSYINGIGILHSGILYLDIQRGEVRGTQPSD
jgi:hypothetical protein